MFNLDTAEVVIRQKDGSTLRLDLTEVEVIGQWGNDGTTEKVTVSGKPAK